MKKTRIVIADDHPIFRFGLRQVLTSDAALEVVAEAPDGETALASVRELIPDVVVLDMSMPGMDGLEVVRAMRAHDLAAAPILLTMHKSQLLLDAALNLGVRGYVLKDSAMLEAVDSVKAVAGGQSYVSPILATFLLGQRARRQDLLRERPGLRELTPAERRVVHLIAEGKGNSEIAKQLCVSVRTVENHRAHICAKLNLRGRDALIHFAVTHPSAIPE